jgi:hypothetical protein
LYLFRINAALCNSGQLVGGIPRERIGHALTGVWVVGVRFQVMLPILGYSTANVDPVDTHGLGKVGM